VYHIPESEERRRGCESDVGFDNDLNLRDAQVYIPYHWSDLLFVFLHSKSPVETYIALH
jgi:hypothetical protein